MFFSYDFLEHQPNKSRNVLYFHFSEIHTDYQASDQSKTDSKSSKKLLTCGKPANFTQYDHLRGITHRGEHPHIPEPEVAIMFRKKGAKSSEVDMTELESKLRKLKKQVCMGKK